MVLDRKMRPSTLVLCERKGAALSTHFDHTLFELYRYVSWPLHGVSGNLW